MSEQTEQNKPSPIFAIEKLYVTDISLESPNAVAAFSSQEKSQVEITFTNQTRVVGPDLHEATLKTTIHVKTESSTTIFVLEITQGGLFRIAHFSEQDVGHILGVACPNIIFPYLREAVSSLTVRAGFPPFLMQSVDFETAYFKQLAEKENKTVQ